MDNKKELIEIKEQLMDIIVRIDKLLPEGDKTEEFSFKHIRRMNILVDILEKGGTVSKVEFHKLVRKNEMDTRGVGGFFIKSNPSLTYFEDAQGEKVALTRKGKENAEKWLKEKPKK